VASQTLTTTSTVARVNLLPPEIGEKRNVRRAQAVMVGATAATVGVVGMLYMAQVARVNSAKDEVAAAEADGVRLQGELKKFSNVSATYAKRDAATALLDTALAPTVAWSQYLNDVSLTIPENVWLTELTVEQSMPGGSSTPSDASGGSAFFATGIATVTVSGKAFTHDDVAAWLDVLAKQRSFKNAYFSKSEVDKQSDIGIVVFDSTATVTDGALVKNAKRGA
jgi:Tfp pilus assembly protein PilN